MKKITDTNTQISNKMSLMNLFTASLVSIILTACGGGGGSGSGTEITKKGEETISCAGSSLDSGSECITLNNRESILYKPTGQQNDGIAIFLHGSPGNASKVMGIFDAKMLADSYNLISISPEGRTPTWGWFSNNNGQDSNNVDIEFLNELIFKVKGDYNVTSSKLFIFGYSAGGFMAYKLACDMPEQITAIVSLAGQFRGSVDNCSTSTPVSVHHFHSPSDKDVPFNGRSFGDILSVEETITHWQQKNGCDVAFDVVEHSGVTSSSSGTITERYQNCVKTVALSKMDDVAHESSYLSQNLLDIYSYLLD
jgi:polyhydroxybutyrate depolymerase